MEQEPIACEIRTDEGIRTFDDNCMGTLRTIDACGCKHIIEPIIYDDYNQRIKADQTCINEHLSPALDTRCDCLGVCVKDEPKKLVEFGTYYTWEDKQGNINTQCNRAANEDNCALTVACAETGKVLEKRTYRIRKLTPKECGRLMGVKDEDIDKMSVNQSNSKLYHLYGDSIVTNCLCEIFKQML